jgi:enoyl-CoA hydratase
VVSVPEALVRSASADRVVTVTLDSPANRNALSRRLVAALRDELAAATAAAGAHAVVLTHTGTTFCSGAALDEMRSGSPADGTRDLLALFRQLLTLPVPVVARVDGAARAGGIGVLPHRRDVRRRDGSVDRSRAVSLLRLLR